MVHGPAWTGPDTGEGKTQDSKLRTLGPVLAV